MFEYSSSNTPPPEPKYEDYDNLHFRMALPHSLWGHMLWNSSKLLYQQLKDGKYKPKNKTVLELGAGVALPSIAAIRGGASKVVISEYAEDCLIDNLKYNLEQNKLAPIVINNLAEYKEYTVSIYPCTWDKFETAQQKFDIIIMCDLVFNRHEHGNLSKIIASNLAQDGVVIFYFSFHCPDKQAKDMNFFSFLDPLGLKYDLVDVVKMDRIFPHEDEIYSKWDISLRENVQCYLIKWK